MRRILEQLQDSIGAHEVIVEKLRNGALVVGYEVGRDGCSQVVKRWSIYRLKLFKALLLQCHIGHLNIEIMIDDLNSI